MTDYDPNDPVTGEDREDKHSDARKIRGIRFSESEWQEVRNAADKDAVPAAEFVRDRVLALARGGSGTCSTQAPPSHPPLIERTFRLHPRHRHTRRNDGRRTRRGDRGARQDRARVAAFARQSTIEIAPSTEARGTMASPMPARLDRFGPGSARTLMPPRSDGHRHRTSDNSPGLCTPAEASRPCARSEH